MARSTPILPAALVLGCLCWAAGCTAPTRPDLICEYAGDTGRYFLPDHRPREKWRVDRTVEYFLGEGRYRVIVRSQAIEWGETDEEQQREATRIHRDLIEQQAQEP